MKEHSKKQDSSPKNRQKLSGSERPRVAGAKLRGALDTKEEVSFTLVLRYKFGSPTLPDLNYWQNTPLSKRKYLSPKEYEQTYGAAKSDVDAATNFVLSQGMTVLHSHAGRRTISVAGTVGQINTMFGIQLNNYESPLPKPPRRTRAGKSTEPNAGTHIHRGFDGPIHLPAELSGIVTAVVGLDNRRVSAPSGGTGDPASSNLLAVPTVARLYNFPNSGATGQTIGVHAPQSTPGDGASYLANDINNLYFPNLTNVNYRTAPASINDVNLTVGSKTFSNSTTSVTALTATTDFSTFPASFIIELTQDISTSATIAQGAAVNVYFTEDSEEGWLVFLNRALLPEGENQPTVITSSYPLSLSDDSGSIGSAADSGSTAHLLSSLFQQLAAVGVCVFIALGDWGSDDQVIDGKTHVSYPGSDPWVTSCGGTVIGNVKTGPPVTFDESVWSDAFSSSSFGSSTTDFGATGGGASANFPAPSYQTDAGITQITDSKGNNLTGRFLPDVAGMVGYSGSGSNDWFFVNGIEYNFIGTSCVAPLYAGLAAVLRAAFGVPLGFLNPTFYQLGNKAFNDITSGNNDSGDTPDAPFFTATAGWDPCTGWGSIDGTKLLNGIAGLMYNQTFYFQVDKSTFGLDEVGVVSNYPDAFWLVLEGFTPNAAAGIVPQVTGAFTALPNVSITVGAAQPEIPSQPNTPQRILYPCSVDFLPGSINTVANGGVFPSPGATPFSLPITGLIIIGGEIFGAAAVIELVPGADPFFTNINPQADNVFYLSQDLRVFTVTPGIQVNPFPGANLLPASNTSYDTGAAYAYIKFLLAILNSGYSDPAGTDPFTLLPDQSSALTADSSVSPSSVNPADPTGTRFSNYNFAIARVRLNGPPNTSTNKNVRVFFRMFATQTSDTDYLTDWTYPSNPSSGPPSSPLLGTGNPPVTIPFFATGNYEANSDFFANTDYSANSANNQPIQIGPNGSVWAYYGCYINVYPTSNTINGQSIQSLLPGTHHCIVAQIAFDDAPIINSNGTTASPENCDKLAQRNLEVTFSDNPGPASTHRIPQTFDLRPSRALSTVTGDLQDYPDELMIDWGNVPIGSVAQIYWPQVSSSNVLTLAKKLYSTHQLSASDANTIRCKVAGGYTYVPVPPGTGENFAGLFTVDLPLGIVAGQSFNIVVRRISSRSANIIGVAQNTPQIAGHAAAESIVVGKHMRNWRYVVGTFAIRIPVTTSRVMLPMEEDTLAIMKWRLTQMSPGNRWYPVLVRYISYIEGRVDGLGGNSSTIQPSPYGVPPKQLHEPGRRYEYTGKVTGVVYDRFGDFEGFVLLTEEGHEHSFHSREHEIEELVRTAWFDRMVITVFTRDHDHHCPSSIILRRVPHRH
jgi:Pro-kumamolisin, activation domain